MSRKVIFLLAVSFLTLISSFFFWITWQEVFVAQSVTNIIGASVATLLLLSLLGLFAYLNEKISTGLIYSFLVALANLFAQPPYSFLGFLVTFLALTLLNLQVYRGKSESLRPNIFKSLNPLRITFTLLSLSLSLNYFPLAVKLASKPHIRIPQELFNSLYQNLIRSQIQNRSSELGPNNLFDPSFNQSITEPLATSFTTPSLDPLAIKSQVEGQINDLIGNYKSYLPYFLSLSLFLTLTFFAAIVVAVATLLVKVYLFLLLKTGLIEIRKETIEIEKITLS